MRKVQEQLVDQKFTLRIKLKTAFKPAHREVIATECQSFQLASSPVNAVVATDHVTAADAEAELGGEGKHPAPERRQVALVFGFDVGLDQHHDLVQRVQRSRELRERKTATFGIGAVRNRPI